MRPVQRYIRKIRMKIYLLLLLTILSSLASAQTVLKPTSLIIGKGTDVNMQYLVDRLGSNNPSLKWDGTTFKWYFSNDGLTFGEMVDKVYVDNAVLSSRWTDTWAATTDYPADVLLVNSSKLYQSLTNHESAATIALDISNGDLVQIANNVTDASGVLPITNGGTNSATALAGSSIMVSNGTGVIQGSAGTTATVLHGNASGLPTYGAVALATEVSGVLPLANGGSAKALTASNGAIAYSDADSLELLAAGTSGLYFKTNGAGSAPSWSAISLSTSSVTGVLPVANGGTNSSTALAGSSIAISNGSALVQGAAGTSTTLLHGNASGAPTYSAASLTADVSGVLPLANGGTAKNMTAAAGGIVYTDSDSMEVTAAGTSGYYLKSNGASAPTWAVATTASDVLTSTGSTTPDVQSVYFGFGANCASPCTTGSCAICRQIGNKITGIDWDTTAGQYRIQGINGSTKYWCSGSAVTTGTGFASVIQIFSLSTTGYAVIQTGSGATGGNASFANITCYGIP